MSTRIRGITTTFAVCLTLCLSLVAFSGTASAHTLRSLSSSGTTPRISVTPRQVIANAAGCATVHIDGSGFLPSILSHPNTTTMNIADADGDVLTQFSIVPVDASGGFSVNETYCQWQDREEFAFLTARDNTTTFMSNTVAIEGNT